MLDVIGAGATASSSKDWHEIWINSPEAKALQRELDDIHEHGRNRPVATGIRTEFATSWVYQFKELALRDAEAHWRDPTYLVAKLVLNAVGGLIVGFTFFKSKNSQQGIQNKLFVRFFLLTLLGARY